MSISSAVSSGVERTAWVDDGTGDSPTHNFLQPSESLGRYVVLYRLGTGGMGVVYAAYDPELDRKVALKLLRRPSSDQLRRKRAQARLLKEARAMAKLTHPNVITVHDVAVVDGRVVVAMEFVDGRTLATALTRGDLTWKEILSAMIGAGRGLAAAHDAGIVHRDFKPDNVMLAKNGRVLVMDFGLARALDSSLPLGGSGLDSEAESAETTAAEVPAQGDEPGSRLAGTPAYMAPEQHRGCEVDCRTDQFAFCVTLYEALYGQRPFRGDTASQLAAEVEVGRVPEPPMHSKVPGWLRAVLVRGLAVRPEERFPSMHELLAALADDPAARRRRWYLGMGAGSVVIATSVAGYLVQSGRDQLCEGGQARLTGVWDDARRSSVEQAFLTSDKPYAEASWTAVARTLDDYAERWTSMHREACQATRVHGAQSDALLEVRMECLGRRLAELRALTDLFIDADAALVQAGVGATGKMVPLAICADVALLTAPIPIPDDPQVRVRVEDVREQLALVKAHEDAGRYPRGAMLAADAVERARQAGYAPVLAESLVRRGRIAFAAGDFSTAESALREAAQQAALGHHDEMAAQAWTSLVGTVGHGQARFERAEELVDMANAAVERAGDSAQFRADLAMAVGALRYNQGRFDAAQRRFEAALTHQMEAVGSDHPSLGRVYNNIAAAAGQQGDDEAFERHLQAALVLNERHFGDQHPLTAMTIANIGAVELQAGSLQEAKASFERALRIWEQAGVGDHPDLGVTVHNRGVVAMLLGELAAAESFFRRAVRVQERALGEHPNVARSLGSLSWVLLQDDRVEPARETLDRAFEIARATIGEDHPEYGQLLAHQGLLRVKTHQNDAALEVLERALTMTESSAQLRRLRPQIQFSMAQASFDRDPARARELALTAIEGYVAQPALDPTQRAQLLVRRWMAEHEFEPSR